MRNPTVTNELHCEGTMFKNRFMAPANDVGYEAFCAGFSNLGFRLIANPPTLFKALQNCGPVNRGDKFHIGVDNFHFCCSSKRLGLFSQPLQ
jgi:hypothetical protein